MRKISQTLSPGRRPPIQIIVDPLDVYQALNRLQITRVVIGITMVRPKSLRMTCIVFLHVKLVRSILDHRLLMMEDTSCIWLEHYKRTKT